MRYEKMDGPPAEGGWNKLSGTSNSGEWHLVTQCNFFKVLESDFARSDNFSGSRCLGINNT